MHSEQQRAERASRVAALAEKRGIVAAMVDDKIKLSGEYTLADFRAILDAIADRREMPTEGPGKELMDIFAELGITPQQCSCASIAGRMNLWGPKGCMEPSPHAVIVATLKANAKKYGWWDYARAAAIAASKGWVFSLSWSGLVEESCRRAEARAESK